MYSVEQRGGEAWRTNTVEDVTQRRVVVEQVQGTRMEQRLGASVITSDGRSGGRFAQAKGSLHCLQGTESLTKGIDPRELPVPE